MYFCDNYALAVVFCVVTMLCWGSWENTQGLQGLTGLQGANGDRPQWWGCSGGDGCGGLGALVGSAVW